MILPNLCPCEIDPKVSKYDKNFDAGVGV